MLFGSVPPSGKHTPAFHEIRMLHLAERLLLDPLIVVWDPCPFAQKRQDCPK